ncbi:MAG: leucine--tRNA ligase [Bacteriovoracaceae bacterium]|nr:leucine--tRNA ligase [Bacteriovoracaceae bacterium]
MEYQFKNIEKKWQDLWEKQNIFQTQPDTQKPKYYILDMFPYPSGSGLHVGHPLGYTATDIIARFKRMKGFNVLHPMGWDSFGLPAENHAIKTGVHPHKITEENITTYKRQLKSIGLSYDWSREVATSHLDYYKWTQWIFVQLYNKGLAYEAEINVNWCPELKTVLANEEVVDGKSEIGGHPVIRKPMKQWMLKITEYAERLLTDLDDLDWPHSIKEMQRTWIGKSEGALIDFTVESSLISIFTTRPDTLFGVTYMVIAPEHPLVKKLTTAEHKENVEKFLHEVSLKSDLERTDLNKDKSGVFTGAYALHPLTQKKIPIWIADYVLASYGTGAVMAVPAHDSRDFEFAKKYNLPLLAVIEADISEQAFEDDGIHINSDFLNGLNNKTAISKMISHLEEKKLGQRKINYKLRDWLFSRQRYWGEPFPILKFEDGTIRCLEAHELPVELPQVEKYEPSGTGESPLATIDTWLNVIDPKTGKKARRETNTMPQWAGSCWYYLRFCDPRNTEEAFSKKMENYWMPVDLYVGGAEHAVLHLLYSRFWHKVLFDLGLVSTKEPFQKLINQGMILGPDHEKMSKSRGNVISVDDVTQNYGADTLRLYEMFMGPLEKTKPWSVEGMKGVHNFISRAYRFFASKENLSLNMEDEEVSKLLHKTIKKVGSDIEEFKFNTSISQMMIFTNLCIKKGKITTQTAQTFALVLAPFAPHVAEEIWEVCGGKESLAFKTWPTFDPMLAKDDLITMAVQINGKTRTTLDVPAGISQADFMALAKKEEKLLKYLENAQIVKEVFIAGKICNLIVK